MLVSRNQGLDRKLSHSDALGAFISLNPEKMMVQSQQQLNLHTQKTIGYSNAPKQKLQLRGSGFEKPAGFSPRDAREADQNRVISPLRMRLGS